ncbi:alanine racemase [Patescibacteria group bacterium]|nr:alanine racemase [Patescibacteria group bacterium]
MSKLIVDTKKIIENIEKIDQILKPKEIEWTLVTKLLSGHQEILEKLLQYPAVKKLHSLGDSRLSNLKRIKEINPKLSTLYIKPPSLRDVPKVIKYADISLNTSLSTIKALNQEAQKQNKIHRIIIMLELGELREGVLGKNLINFYQQTFNLSHIKIIGIGANLGCMYGIQPTRDKMIQLSLYKQLLEAKFNKKIKYISGGSSITLPLVKRKIPNNINHFRIGESAFVGTNPLTGKKFKNLNISAFKYQANIIEMKKKDSRPQGQISQASVGHTSKIKKENIQTYRAILDFGLLDVDAQELQPAEKNISLVGTTSDMSVYDLGHNLTKDERLKKKVGNNIKFKPSYMAVAKLLHSRYTRVEIK